MPSAPGVTVDLIWTLVRTDFKVRYHGSAGGFVWALLKPITMFALLVSVFSYVFPDQDYKLNLVLGLFQWDFFAESTKVGLRSLQTQGFLLTRAKCPSWILVIASLSNALLTLVMFSLALLVYLVTTGRAPSLAAILLYGAYCTALVAVVVGFSLAASVVFLRYRDLDQVWDLATQAGFFVAPIIYPLGVIPERYHLVLYAWPPTPVLEFSRDVLVRGRMPTLTAHLCLAAMAALCLAIGVIVFRRHSPRAAEHV